MKKKIKTSLVVGNTVTNKFEEDEQHLINPALLEPETTEEKADQRVLEREDYTPDQMFNPEDGGSKILIVKPKEDEPAEEHLIPPLDELPKVKENKPNRREDVS